MMPEPVHPLTARLAAWGKRLILLYRSFRPVHAEIKGICRGEKSVRRIHYIGEGETLPFLKKIIFSDIREETIKRCSLFHCLNGGPASGKFREPVIVEINRLFSPWIRSDWRFPPWIRQIARFHDSDALSLRIRKNDGTYGRRVRQYGYKMDISRDAKDLRDFYVRFYRPYIRACYPDMAYVRSPFELCRPGISGFLLRVIDKENAVAGVVVRKTGKTVTTLAFGLLPEYKARLRQGALSSAYFFLLAWARKNKILTLDFRRSRPHTRDGLYEHKRRWGAQPFPDPWPHTMLHIHVSTHAILPENMHDLLVLKSGRLVRLADVLKNADDTGLSQELNA